jgi:hypothetical protein
MFRVEISGSEKKDILIEASPGYTQFLQTNAGVFNKIRPQSLHSTSFPVYDLLIFLSFVTTYSELLTAYLNKRLNTQINK